MSESMGLPYEEVYLRKEGILFNCPYVKLVMEQPSPKIPNLFPIFWLLTLSISFDLISKSSRKNSEQIISNMLSIVSTYFQSDLHSEYIMFIIKRLTFKTFEIHL